MPEAQGMGFWLNWRIKKQNIKTAQDSGAEPLSSVEL
jgi:hypothetical protein